MPSDPAIGLPRGVVRLVAHRPIWAECFLEEKEILLGIMSTKVLDIRHIGSTSIAGIPAKPIIDIVAAVSRLTDVELFTADLKAAGYEDKHNGGLVGRRFFVKGPEANRTHHLNFCEMNSDFWTTHLAFRDYLEGHPEAAEEYSLLKRSLAQQFPNDREAYTSGKEEFVRVILKRALRQAQS